MGFSVVAEAARAAVKPGEPIVLRLTFRNASGDAFRLPDQITPPPFNYWYLKLQEATARKTYTGFSTRPMGAAPEPGEINPELLRGGEVKTASAAFAEFAFLEGDMDFQAARNVWFPQRQSGTFPLPAGTYNVRVVVRFRAFPSRPNLPQNIQDAQRAHNRIRIAIGRDPKSPVAPKIRPAVIPAHHVHQTGNAHWILWGPHSPW